MTPARALTEKHNLRSTAIFRLKFSFLIIKRWSYNIFSTHKKFPQQSCLNVPVVIAVSESDLWNNDDTEQNWILTAGKVENLRLAAKQLNGIEVEANMIFSFWKHVGNPHRWKGYVIGRELREGCIIPTIAGGLCQLSNALYDAALKAGFEIVERHRHTKIIKGSLAEQDRDATVKWNYIDLRFKSNNAFKIEIDISADKLIVTFKSVKKIDAAIIQNSKSLVPSKLNDCYSCGNFTCFKHPGVAAAQQEKGITTFILDEKWSEYETYIQSVSTEKDIFIVPSSKNDFIKLPRFCWAIKNSKNIKAINFKALLRALQLMLAVKTKKNIFSTLIQSDKKIAMAGAKHIPVESTHLVIAQNLLPFLWQKGVLGGRTFDVLMTRLPIEILQQRLDKAHKSFPESKTLNDFRANETLVELENIALTKARHIITPHKEIAGIFKNKAVILDWALPQKKAIPITRNKKILFPASALGRKGAYEIRRLAIELNLSIILSGRATEAEGFWKGVQVEFAGDNIFENIGLVVYPTYVEHQPRLLLKALGLGIPVITTTACGLSPANNLTIIPIGDYEMLKEKVRLNYISA